MHHGSVRVIVTDTMIHFIDSILQIIKKCQVSRLLSSRVIGTSRTLTSRQQTRPWPWKFEVVDKLPSIMAPHWTPKVDRSGTGARIWIDWHPDFSPSSWYSWNQWPLCHYWNQLTLVYTYIYVGEVILKANTPTIIVTKRLIKIWPQGLLYVYVHTC